MINIANTDFSMLNSNPNRIGVLTNTEVLLVDVVQGKQVLRSNLVPVDADNLSGLLEHLWQLGLSEVWILPNTTLSQSATCALFEDINDSWVAVVHPNPSEPDRPTCAILLPRGNGQREARRLTFVFPEHAGWNWVLPDARSLLATVTYLNQTLARPVIDSPDLLAHQLLSDLTLDQSTSELSPPLIDLHTLHSRDGETLSMIESAHDLVWMRPLTLVEQRQRYLHKYKHISPYLEACTGIRLGAGEPEFSSTGRAYDGIRPGMWRVDVEHAGSIFDGKKLPYFLDGEWISTPQVKCCADIGYRVYVREGYYWSQSHEPLKRWGMTLWQAAERLHSKGYQHEYGKANASRSIELLAQLGVAILAKEKNDGGRARPDWRMQIVGRSRAILFIHLASFARKGLMPVLVDKDAIWIVSEDPNPLTTVPWLRATHQWRGYFVGYNVPLPLTNDIKAIFRTTESPGQVARALDALADGSQNR
ncbi:MAG TPA: hypothetical protein VNW73_06860 [Ktedonobacteraceae bacterium]|nr:hypothetical protein [Ktedonobacteraceae bacterium]